MKQIKLIVPPVTPNQQKMFFPYETFGVTLVYRSDRGSRD